MPELPDIVVYLEALGPRVVGRPLEALRIPSPFLLRTVDPPVADVTGRVVRELRRLGKRIVFRLDDEYFIVLHLMIAGRLRWPRRGDPAPLRSRRFRLPQRHAAPDRGEQEAARLHPLGAGRTRPRRARPRGSRGARGRSLRLSG